MKALWTLLLAIVLSSAFAEVNELGDHVVAFSDDTAKRLFDFGIDTIVLFRYRGTHGEKAAQVFREAADELHSRMTFMLATFDEVEEARNFAGFFGVRDEELPAIRLLKPRPKMRKALKYIFDKEITVDNIKEAVNDFHANKLEYYVVSEPIPTNPYDGDVRIIVGNTWKEIVLDKTKDVFVEFYAPWCGECENVAPLWQGLAAKLKNYKDLVIAKIDPTVNEIEELETHGFPTFKLFRKHDKHAPIQFHDSIRESDFIAFLQRHDALSGEIPEDTTSTHHEHRHDTHERNYYEDPKRVRNDEL